MLVIVTKMIARGNRDVKCAHYGSDIFPTNSNNTIDLLHSSMDLEEPPKNSSRKLYSEEITQCTITKAILQGLNTSFDSFLPLLKVLNPTQTLASILVWQLDDAPSDNKNRRIFVFCLLLEYKGISTKCTSTSL